MKNILKVTGKGSISLRPDTIRIILTITDTKENYDDAVKKSTEDTGVLKNCIENIGFKKEDLKTLAFNVNMQYENQKDKDDVWKRVLVGYTYNHQLKLEFERDNNDLGKILYALVNSKVKPQIDISYTIKDLEAAKNELLSKAVEDSKNKAQILAKAAGVGLGEIVNIIYSKEEKTFDVMPVRGMMLKSAAPQNDGAYNMDIEPENIVADDTVTIMWEIE